MRRLARLILSTKMLVMTLMCLCVFVAMSTTSARAAAADAYPAGAIIDRSTPEDCLSFFIRATNEIRDDMEFFKKNREESGSWIYPQPSEEERRRIDYLMSEILDSMDLSAVPEWSRDTMALKRAL